MEKQQTPAEMFRERQNTIKEYRSETQLSIMLGQALNLAVGVQNTQRAMCKLNEGELPYENVIEQKELDRLVNFFMSYLDKKRKEVFDQNERMYAQNPAPTVSEYEAMTDVQKAFLKDKQLENNRKAYAERKEVSPEQNRLERIVQKQKGLQADFKKLNEDRTK